MATQKDIQSLEQRLSTQIKELEERIVHQFGVIAEQMMNELKGATLDKLDLHSDKLSDHKNRLERIEEAVGFNM